MPWKATKLKFFGVSVRRRTLYVLTLLFAILAVFFLSLALINSGAEAPAKWRNAFTGGACITVFVSLIGFWTIVRQQIVLYWEEARYIWPASIPVLLVTMWVTYVVAKTSFSRGRLDYLAPLTFGTLLLAFFLVRCALLNRHPKKKDIVRGESGPMRPRANRSLPVANVMIEEMEKLKHSKERAAAQKTGQSLDTPDAEEPLTDDLDD
jgi:hypothetical protein